MLACKNVSASIGKVHSAVISYMYMHCGTANYCVYEHYNYIRFMWVDAHIGGSY